MKKFGLLLVALLSTACAKTGLAAANFPALFSDQKITRDIDFGSKYGSKLDVYTPGDTAATHPVIVFFYGGKWETGSKNDYRFAADAFTSQGYVVVIPDYVKYPKAKFPAWQDDAAKSVNWVHDNIQKYNGDVNKLFVMGHSAGAQIGALLAADKSYGVRGFIKGFAGLAGPYDFTPEDEDIKDMFKDAGENYRQMRVTNFIDGKEPPMLLLWGKDDKDVGEVNITKLKSALDARHGDYKVIFYDNVDHIDIVAALALLARNRAPVVSDVDAWFER